MDVPGHERFVKNMLAGVHGIDAVALVVAADESVMPRCFSSGRRSGSVPVSARTRALLPWSMWPAVPTINDRMGEA